MNTLDVITYTVLGLWIGVILFFLLKGSVVKLYKAVIGVLK